MSFFRAVALLCTTLPVVAPAASLTEPAAPVTTHYRYESQTEQQLDLTAVGGGQQSSTLSRIGWLSVTLTDSAGGKVMRAVIDSISADAASREAMGAASLDSARGAVITGFVAPDGEVSNFRMSNIIGTLGALLGGSLDEFFPRVKRGWKSGDTWSIATEKPQIVPNSQLLVKKSTTYTGRGPVQRDGIAANAFDVVFSTTSTGSQMVGPTNAQVVGTSTGTGTWFVSADGLFLGGTRTEKNDRKLMLTGAPAPVLVMATVRTTIAVVR